MLTVKTAARAVRASDATGCGADKPTYKLRVSAGADTMLYGDEFYACLKQVPRYVEGIDGLSQVLAELRE
jgi:hypothetical protein